MHNSNYKQMSFVHSENCYLQFLNVIEKYSTNMETTILNIIGKMIIGLNQ